MSNARAIASADQIESIYDTSAAAIWSLRLSDCDPEERRALIDHHAQVLGLLRARGRLVRASVVWQDGQEFVTLRIVRGGSNWPVT